MTPRFGAAIAAGVLAVGILVGAAGTIVVRDATSPGLADHMRGMTAAADSMGHMAGMLSTMGGGHRAEMSSMMSMMGAGSSMMPDASMDPWASTSPEDHLQHHASPSPAATR